MKKKIVITGMGMVSSLGIGLDENWERYLSGVSEIKEYEIEGMDLVTHAGKVSDDKLGPYIPEKKKGKIDRFTCFAMVASKMALEDAKIDEGFEREKIGVFIGSAFSGLNIIEKQLKVLYREGPRRVHPLLMQNNITNASSGEVAIEFTLKGPNIGFASGGCSAGYSLIQACNTLQLHDIDAIVVGGTEAPLLPYVFAELKSNGLYQTNGYDQDKVSRPFDSARKGFVLSEGSGVVILETLRSAEKRGAEIYGELVGCGASYGKNNYTNQQNHGFLSKVACIQQALESAAIQPSQVEYINASGISGIEEDREESEVMQTVFGRDVQNIPVSSTKGTFGYSIGASGAIDAIFSLLSLKKQTLPQTQNLEHIDPSCGTIPILKESMEKPVNIILSNNFDYAGNNVSLVFRRI
ncbi:MAG: beta-ketoacyl-[acyl-carrier-protein] synthase family protein [Candidatus Brocadiaceae bacterium]|nr:beta-ketoacyl-[acyl-carrier-protein] synthase family protein [Candidatus Brocadiaceae bacterium]